MSTRSTIIERTATGNYRGIYCHSDGYVEAPHGVGAKLAAHYTDPAKVSALIDLGSLSELGERLEPTPGSGHHFDYPKREPGVTVAYHRDRGEAWEHCAIAEGHTARQVAAAFDNDFDYVFEDGKWTVNGEDLATALAETSAA